MAPFYSSLHLCWHGMIFTLLATASIWSRSFLESKCMIRLPTILLSSTISWVRTRAIEHRLDRIQLGPCVSAADPCGGLSKVDSQWWNKDIIVEMERVCSNRIMYPMLAADVHLSLSLLQWAALEVGESHSPIASILHTFLLFSDFLPYAIRNMWTLGTVYCPSSSAIKCVKNFFCVFLSTS